MSSSIQSTSTGLTANAYSNYNFVNSLVSNDEAESSDFASITNMDSYVKASTSSVTVDSTYSAKLLKQYNISDLTAGLNSISDTEYNVGITNLNDYVNQTFAKSQTSQADELDSVASILNSGYGSSTLPQGVINAYKMYSTLSSTDSSSIDLTV